MYETALIQDYVNKRAICSLGILHFHFIPAPNTLSSYFHCFSALDFSPLEVYARNRKTKITWDMRNETLTQHALRLPRVVVPGLHSVLHVFRNAVRGHVLHCAVHARAVVCLIGCRGAHHVSHLVQQEWMSFSRPIYWR